MNTIRLTMAQALVRFLAAQRTLWQGRDVPLFGGVWAIFGHGNVAGIGEALYGQQQALPTYRAHNEQAMAHAAIAYAKAHFRRRMMACTTSIGPGATNLITAAATAHANRLPVLFLPGDVFVSRAPDPVLQQVEDFGDGTISANDCFRPVSRYFDRIVTPEQLLTALPRAIAVLTDPARCGPVTLALPQDVQAQAYDFPEAFFEPALVRVRAPVAEAIEVEAAAGVLRAAKRPLLIAGGGVLYSDGGPAELRRFAEAHRIPVAETQAGKSALPWDHPLQAGAVGVTGATAANALAHAADAIIAVGTRLQDFTTGSHSLFNQARLLAINVNAFDAIKLGAISVVGDAATTLAALSAQLAGWSAPASWRDQAVGEAAGWRDTVSRIVGARDVAPPALPYDGEVMGAVQRSHPESAAHDIVVCAAGSLPGELHKLWRAAVPGAYHVEYGYSCMGYEIAGGIGVKMAHPEREVVVLVGDGSYLMLNSEIATSVMLGVKLLIVVLDNRGYGCIHRLQLACGVPGFNNLFDDCIQAPGGAPAIDFAAHARSLGATSRACGIDRRTRSRAGPRAPGGPDRGHRQSTPIRSAPPKREAGGGRWAFPRYRSPQRCAMRAARGSRANNSKGGDMGFDVRIGINPISWTNDDLPSLGGETSLETALSEGKQIGYEGFELGNKFPREPEALKAVLGAHGLACVSGWYSGRLARRSVEDEIAAVGTHLNLLVANGANVMVYGEVADSVQGSAVSLKRRPRFDSDAEWERYGERVSGFARHLASRGVRLAYHHHMGAYVETPDRRRPADARNRDRRLGSCTTPDTSRSPAAMRPPS